MYLYTHIFIASRLPVPKHPSLPYFCQAECTARAAVQPFLSCTAAAQLQPKPWFHLPDYRINPAALYFLCSASDSPQPWGNAWIHCYMLLILPYARVKWRYGRPLKLLFISYIYVYIMWFLVNVGSLKTRACLPPSDKAVLPNHRAFSNPLCT